MEVRTRIAPSPTGFVHIGTIHNALFAHALARHHGGKFILRVEDTDLKRFVEGAKEQLYDVLDEFGLTPDEGPIQGGPYAPYIQSERMKTGIYLQKAEELISKGHAYYCFMTEKELADMKGDKEYQAKAFRSIYRDMPIEEAKTRISNGEKYVIRLKVPDNEIIEVDDAILGKVSWKSEDIDDQVLIKSDGYPTYHLAVVVDDHEMAITHITRAYEWLPSTPKQVLLYKYLGFKLPVFAHSSLILDPDGGKLSKRKGTVSARQFLEDGYLVDAIKNFLMLLGWAPPIERVHGQKEREIFSQEDLIKLYELRDRQKSNAVFNREKLIWFNQQYIKTVPNLDEIFIKWLQKYKESDELISRILDDKEINLKLDLIKDRAKTLVEMIDMLKFFYIAPEHIDLDIKQIRSFKKDLKNILSDTVSVISKLDEDSRKWQNDIWANSMKEISNKYDLKTGDSFMVLRLAVVGEPVSPPLFEAIGIIGKEEILNRLNKLIKDIK